MNFDDFNLDEPPKAVPEKKKKEKKTYEDIYEKKTHLEQIILRPDSYIGSAKPTKEKLWLFNEATQEMEMREITFVPGLYKIFDEIIVNAADNKQRDTTQNRIKIDINKEEGYVKVWNNGEGVPVHIHKEHNVYIPDLIFGHLLTSSNYDDDEKKTTGGRNGYGAKLANIFSTKFVLETCHTKTGLKFKKTWRNNMTESDPEVVTKVSDRDTDYTCVTFWPDFKKFSMSKMDDDIEALMIKRAYDLAGVTDASLKVVLNGKTIPVKNFQEYIELFPGLGEEKHRDSFANVNDRWQICVRPSNIEFQQVSFVNSIWTIKGGRHVTYIVDQVVNKAIEMIEKKNKKVKITAQHVKPFLWVFVNAQIENPSFDSQTKENLTTLKSEFGSKCEVPTKMVEALTKVIMERVMDRVNNRINRQMAAKVAGARSGRVLNVPKLDDANDAGTRKSETCTLILTEGDSARSMVLSAIGSVGRDQFGVFPLRGKLLNVRDAPKKQIADCKEIQNLMKILGLKPGEKYDGVKDLRYGSVMIMTDQDHDGSHIKGLLINLFHAFWPQLLNVPGFLVQFITPIVKAFPAAARRRGDESGAVSFFTIPDFLKFKEQAERQGKKYEYKYYKGLGTSTSQEAKEYFDHIRNHKVDFVYDGGAGEDDRSIRLAFSKDQIEARKRWITSYKPSDSGVDYNIKQLGYSEFINKELILFSIADCERSIPNVLDGLKPGQRKILFGCFKRNLIREVKVAQLSGYVSEHAAYHHGEKALQDTIVNMAQDFTGSNNLPLLSPKGQFGARNSGGKDHAAARYIHTQLEPVTRYIFPKVDDNLLVYKDDDGLPVEPEHYLPIIPTVLMNGCSGIGTGFATFIPNFNPLDLVGVVRDMIHGREPRPLVPWYRGFRGEIKPKSETKFSSFGKFEIIDSSVVRIRELPVRLWTDDFISTLNELQDKQYIISYRNHATNDVIDIDVGFDPVVLERLREKDILREFFGLTTHLPCSNLICFNSEGRITKYPTPQAMVDEWYYKRLDMYGMRKKYMEGELERSCEKLRNMVRFIREVNEGKLVVQKKKRAVLLEELKERDYKPFPPVNKKKYSKTVTQEEPKDEHEDVDPTDQYFVTEGTATVADDSSAKDYEYLLGMKIWSLTYERAAQLEQQLKKATEDLEALRKKTVKEMWCEDLDELEKMITKANKDWEEAASSKVKKGKVQTRLTSKLVKVNKQQELVQKTVFQEIEKLSLKKSKDAAKPKEPRKKKAKMADTKDDLASSGSDDETFSFSPDQGSKADSAKSEPKTQEAPAKSRARKRTAVVSSDSDDEVKPTRKKRSPPKGKEKEKEKEKESRAKKPKEEKPKEEKPKPKRELKQTKLSFEKAKADSARASLFDDDDEDFLNFDPNQFGLAKLGISDSANSKETDGKSKEPEKKQPKKRSSNVLDDDDDDDDEWKF